MYLECIFFYSPPPVPSVDSILVGSSSSNALYPTSSRSSSPTTLVRRDSILKRAGSGKGEQKKNVSIAADLPSVELISERRRAPGKATGSTRRRSWSIIEFFICLQADLRPWSFPKEIVQFSRSVARTRSMTMERVQPLITWPTTNLRIGTSLSL